MGFSRRRIDLTFQLGTGAFGESGLNTLKVSGLRVQAHIIKAGGDSMSEAQLKVYGLTPDQLNRLSALTNVAMMQRKNNLIVDAGDDGGMATVFKGHMALSWADLNDPPNSVLAVSCYGGFLQKLEPVPVSSYPGNASVVTIMQALAKTMELPFENNGVTAQLSTPYYAGTAWEQVRRCADHAGINWMIDDDVLAIWPKDSTRFAGIKPLVSVETGMVGYPAFNGVGISVTTLFNPSIHFGQNVSVKSVIQQATGDWNVNALSHNLTSETPGGEWFTHFSGVPLTNIHAIGSPQ